MGLFYFLKQPNIDELLNEYYKDVDAVLLDVRTPREYKGGHIPQSKNVPLQTIDKVTSVVENKNTKLYVYCQSGSRSKQAVAEFKKMGYSNVINIGGISAYSGKVER